MAKINTGPTVPTSESLDSAGGESAHDVENAGATKPSSSEASTGIVDVSERSGEGLDRGGAPSTPEAAPARPSLASLNLRNAASARVPGAPDELDSESILLDGVNLGEFTDTGPSFEMTPAVGGAAPAGVEITADDGVVEITEGETFGDPFDARWEILHPGSLVGLTPRSPDSAFAGPPLTGDPIRLRFRLKEPAPGRVYNIRVPGPELSLKDALRVQAKNAAKVMDRLGNGGLGRFKKVLLESDGEMNVWSPQFKEGEDLHTEFGVRQAERLEFSAGRDAVLHHIGGRVDTGHKDFFRDRIFDPRERDEPSEGTPSDNEAEALTKSIRKACVHGGLVIGDGASPVHEPAPARERVSLEDVRRSIAAVGEIPAVKQPYLSLLPMAMEVIKPDDPRADELVELVELVEGNFKAVSAAREALEREHAALAREAGASDANLSALMERLAEYQRQRTTYEEGLAAFKDDCDLFVPFLERLLEKGS